LVQASLVWRFSHAIFRLGNMHEGLHNLHQKSPSNHFPQRQKSLSIGIDIPAIRMCPETRVEPLRDRLVAVKGVPEKMKRLLTAGVFLRPPFWFCQRRKPERSHLGPKIHVCRCEQYRPNRIGALISPGREDIRRPVP